MDTDQTPADDPNEPTELETQMLAFKTHWCKYAGAKETAIRTRFDLSATGSPFLNVLNDKPAVHAAAPLLVGRLRRLPAERQRQRSASRMRERPNDLSWEARRSGPIR